MKLPAAETFSKHNNCNSIKLAVQGRILYWLILDITTFTKGIVSQ